MQRSKKFLFGLTLGILCLIAVFSFMLYMNGANDVVAQEETMEEETIAYVDTLIPAMTREEMAVASDLIVKGKITDKKQLQIKPVDEESPIVEATDYTVETSEVLRGEAKGKTVTIRVIGNNADGIEYSSDIIPALSPGQEYLFLLYQPGMGGSYNTKGDYYYIMNCNTGVYENSGGAYLQVLENADADDAESQTIEEQKDPNISDYDAYVQQVKTINEVSPATPGHFKSTYFGGLQANVESGWIPQEEYDAAVKESEIYATIVD